MTQRFTLHPAVLATLEPGRERSLARRFRRRVAAVLHDETGAATAEYAIAMMAAVGFAGLLVVIMRGDEVRELLTGLVRQALSSAG